MKNLVPSSLLSLGLHSLLLACCCALPAQKLVPVFQAGNSSLTLTALSAAAPENAPPAPHQPLAEQDRRLEPESDDPDDFPALPDKPPEKPAAPKPASRKMPLDADARIKGVAGGLNESAGIRPYYPLGARLRGEEGIVKIEVCVGTDGHVLDCALEKSSGFAALDNAALTAVKSARFISAKLHSIKHASRTTLTFRFDIVD